MDPIKSAALRALQSVVDPETGIDILGMGLVYGLEIHPDRINLTMTMTSHSSPSGVKLLRLAHERLSHHAEGREVVVRISWDPPWSHEMVSKDERSRLPPRP